MTNGDLIINYDLIILLMQLGKTKGKNCYRFQPVWEGEADLGGKGN